MRENPDLVVLKIPRSVAVDFADAMDIAENAFECMKQTDPAKDFMQLCSDVEEHSGVTQEDLSAYASAFRRVSHTLSKELPKHFPELSRAAQRGHLDEEDMGFI